ncbi:MAG: hypothetical protein IPN33_18700 [Saprospiraceae bacterium]|nr:hypothetical protein [Saprospiraceae bacterium]
MLKKVILLLAPLAALLCGMACQSREVEELSIDQGYDYQPLSVGRWWIYEVDSLVYDPAPSGTLIDSVFFQLREEVADTFRDNNGALAYRIVRSERSNASAPWQVKSVYALTPGEQRLIRTDNNLNFIAMVFPVAAFTQWDGNAFIDDNLIIPIAGEPMALFKGWNYRYTTVDEPLNLSDLYFPKVATLVLADNENLIERRYAQEQYARGVGLVYRELQLLDTQCNVCCNGNFASCESLPWEDKGETGFILRQRLIAYQ